MKKLCNERKRCKEVLECAKLTDEENDNLMKEIGTEITEKTSAEQKKVRTLQSCRQQKLPTPIHLMIQEAILMMTTVTRNLRQKTTTRSQNDSPEERNQPTEEETVILHLHQVAAVEEDHDALHHQLHPTAVTAAAAAAAVATVTAATAVTTETD